MIGENYSRCWLPDINNTIWFEKICNLKIFKKIFLPESENIKINTLKYEINFFVKKQNYSFVKDKSIASLIFDYDLKYLKEEYSIKYLNKKIFIYSKSNTGLIYAFFNLLKLIQLNYIIYNKDFYIRENPQLKIRMLNHWDNIDGSIERGYSGNSIFFLNNKVHFNLNRIRDYSRLLSSIGINSLCINNVNVTLNASYLITKEWLFQLYEIYSIFCEYNIKLFVSINYKSPVIVGGLSSFDPLDKDVKLWWFKKIEEIYEYMPKFGGFVVKANSEGTSGPLDYGRDHAQGSKPIANALSHFGGILFWRCFVYNNKQNWRNRNIDRACSAYDHFNHLNGLFEDNVILQIKNGPMDFQVREPVSPLLGSMNLTSQVMELQITQEYTGQQIDLCWLFPQWKYILNFDTFYLGNGSTISKLLSGNLYKNKYYGITAVSNIGDNFNWTGNDLAQSNLFSYGNLLWNLNITSNDVLTSWIRLTYNDNPLVIENIKRILLNSWETYENYTSPLGIGWMVNPVNHYGPNVDGYEYSNWGTYHYATKDSLGINRSVNGSNFVNQYFIKNKNIFNNYKTCPEELLLFFHHLSYEFLLKSNKTIIQHIYDSHFLGVDNVYSWISLWDKLEKLIPFDVFINVKNRLQKQYLNSCEWRDQINTYFFRKSGIKDRLNRKIYL